MIRHIFSLLTVFSTPAFARTEPLDVGLRYRHQGQTATCWLQCGTSSLDLKASRQYGVEVSFSSEFILLQDLRSRALARFSGIEVPWDPGAGMTRAYALSLEHGLYPDDVWRPKNPIQGHAKEIGQRLDNVIQRAHRKNWSQKEFVQAMDQELIDWVGDFPPEDFTFLGRKTNARLLANEIIDGDAVAIEFRPLPYNGKAFEMVPEQGWTTVISQFGELKPITQIVGKQLILKKSAADAIQDAIEIFKNRQPLYFTFIYFDDDKKRTFDLVDQAYVATNPPRTTYSSSHFVMITRMEEDQSGNFLGFWVRDSVSPLKQERFVSRDFIEKLGKTFHTLAPNCKSYLQGSHKI